MLSRIVSRLNRDLTYSSKSALRLGRKSSPARCCAHLYGCPSVVAAKVSPNDILLIMGWGWVNGYKLHNDDRSLCQ